VRRPIWPWLLVAAWCLLIFVLSSVPGRNLPEMPAQNADKVVHGLVYGILGALFQRAVGRTWRVGGPATAAIAVVLATAYGVSDELHQLLTPGRSADVYDVFADAVGAALGVLAMSILLARRRRSGAAAPRPDGNRR
jgi:VanZ family protein